MVSKLVGAIAPSATLTLVGKVGALRAEGKDVIGMHIGEPDFTTPAHICAAAKAAIDSGKTHYTPTAGIPDLRKAICAKLKKENNLTFDPSQICCSNGAKQALSNTLLTICNPGDEVILPTPCWVSYIELIKLAGAVPVLVKTREEDGFQLNSADIAAAISNKTKAIIITNPNNPTGALYPKKVLEEIGKLVLAHDFYIISDEIYESLIYTDEPVCSIASLSRALLEHTIVINGFSKSYAMTGWRVGYSAAPADIAKGIADLQGHTSSNCCSIAQYAGLAALQGPQDSVAFMRDEYNRRRAYLLGRLRAMPGITCADARGAFYLMPNISAYFGKQFEGKAIANSSDFATFMLEQALVSMVPGSAFEAPDCVRLSYPIAIEQLKKAADRMETALKLLQ